MATNQNVILEIAKNFYSDLLQSKRSVNPMQNHEYFLSDTNISPGVLKSLNEAELSTTPKQGIITLLPKNNKPREYIQNWRPITLLNVE